MKLHKENQRLLMKNDILKQAVLIMFKSRCDWSQPISAMSKVLGIARSTYYYEAKKKTTSDRKLNEKIIRIFKASRNIYGTRKIKVELKKED